MAILTFYFDVNCGKRFPELIRQAKPPFTIEYQLDPKNKFKFKESTTDDEWLAKVGAEGSVFSHDRKFHKEIPAVAAIKRPNIGCFYLWGAQMPIWDKLVWLYPWCEMIKSAIERSKKPFIYHLTHHNRLREIGIP